MSAAEGFVQDRETIARNRRTMFRRLAHYVGRNKPDYVFGVITTLAYAGLFVALPVLTGWCIQALTEGYPAEEVARRCGWLLLVAVSRSGVRFFSRVRIFNAARNIEYQLRNDLFEHLQRLPQSFYFRWRTGDLMSRCVNDLTAVRLMLGPGLLSVAQTPVLLVVTLVAMFWVNSKLALLVLIPYPLFILISRAFGRAMHSSNLAVQVGLADLSNHLQETVSGISVVKAYAMEGATRGRFGGLCEELYRRQLRIARVNGAMPAVVSLLPMIGMWIIFLVGGQAILDRQMTIAEFFTFSMFNYELTFPIFIMGWVFALVQRGTASMQRIDEVLSTVPAIADHPETEPVDELRGDIEFRDLSFRYPTSEREPAIRGLDLRIPEGTVVGIVGPVGAGKTTLASLIPRLFEVEDGHVFVDGVDVNHIPLAILRSNIAMVPQDSFLFSMPLADNVAYGLPRTERATVERAAERAQLAKDVEDLPGGYDTVVGERGVMLSGGQRQRTALARALALDPRILILDDTLSAVDAETEAAIQENLREVFAGRTVVIVASRVSTVREADQIVVMDEGRIVERGDHESLLAEGGLYARLALDQEVDETEPEHWVAEGAQ
ncbi:MAG: multidrug ABC transporter ATP-binding protein [Deltaproteobacteria bacterium]|nr:multidrug ABC transporter ATP-binding protein [Deltaproteobacteria bacterium]